MQYYTFIIYFQLKKEKIKIDSIIFESLKHLMHLTNYLKNNCSRLFEDLILYL